MQRTAAGAIIAVQGPNARTKVWEVLPQTQAATEALKCSFAVEVGNLFVASTGYTGEDGFEQAAAGRGRSLVAGTATAGVKPCGLGARDTLRLEAGMPLTVRK